MQFAITDATGRTIPGGSSPLLTNEVGKTAAPAPSALAVSPATATASACAGKTFQFVIVGGTPPYSASIAVNPQTVPPIVPTLSPTPVTTSGGILSVAFAIAPPVPGGTVSIVTTTDTSSPQKSASSTITCN